MGILSPLKLLNEFSWSLYLRLDSAEGIIVIFKIGVTVWLGIYLSGVFKVSTTSWVFIQYVSLIECLFLISFRRIIIVTWIILIVLMINVIILVTFLFIIFLLVPILNVFLLFGCFWDWISVMGCSVAQIISTIFAFHITLLRVFVGLRVTILLILVVIDLIGRWFWCIRRNWRGKSFFGCHIDDFSNRWTNITQI